MIIKINPKIIVYGRKIQNLCKCPYYGHPKGCPNYEEKTGCPPNQPLINNFFDFDKDLFLAYTGFGVGKFAERMKKNHPEWKNHPRQWYNPRRWQGTARKNHRLGIEEFLRENGNLIVNNGPEAHGVNVTDLMEKVGVTLNWDWPPKHNLKNKTYIVSLIGNTKK